MAMILSHILMLFFALAFFFMMMTVSILSLREKENTAAFRSFLGAFLLPVPFVLLLFLDTSWSPMLSFILAGVIALSAIIVLFPLPLGFQLSEEKLSEQFDERDVIFVRNRLEEGSDNFDEYYSRKPEKQEPDNRFRSEPGLLSPHSSQADPFMYASTAASFITCENLIPLCDGPVSQNRSAVDPYEAAQYIKEWGKHLGAVSVGITELKEDHIYSTAGRGGNYGKPVENKHKYAIAFTVEMDHDFIRMGPKAPAVMESAQQYLNAGTIAVQLAAFIRQLGYPARAHIDANYQVVCPTIARDAGLGEIGRMGILITPELGPRVRVNVVTTDLPLTVDERKYDGSVIDFCSRCQKCADVCPGRAIPKGDREMDKGVLRWKINHEKCFTLWCRTGTDCGRCMATCPYSHPDNLMHNIIRFFIKHSPVFRRIAATMDDILYGRKPKPLKLTNWQKRLVGAEAPARLCNHRSTS